MKIDIPLIKISYRNTIPTSDRVYIYSSETAYQYFLKSWDDNKMDLVEEAKMILLSQSKCVLGLMNLSSGGLSGTVVDPKMVFASALMANAASIILAHNHPSGNLKPSAADKSLTGQISKAGDLLALKLDDHLIISRNGFYSFADDFAIW